MDLTVPLKAESSSIMPSKVPKDFDPKRISEHSTEYTSLEVEGIGEILVPKDAPGGIEQAAQDAARQLLRAESGLDPELLKGITETSSLPEHIADAAGYVMVGNLLGAYHERAPDEADKNPLSETQIDELATFYAEKIEPELEEDREQLLRRMFRQITAWTLSTLEETHSPEALEGMPDEEYQAVFRGAFEEGLSDALKEYVGLYAQSAASVWLGALKPATVPLPRLRSYLHIEPARDIVFPTSKLHGHMNKHVMNRQWLTLDHAVKTRLESKAEKQYRMRSEMKLPDGAEAVHTEEMMQRMASTLLEKKRNGAALLKTQLDLINEAYSSGGPHPTFRYNYESALGRLGYERLSEGYFHPNTVREHHTRVVTLCAQWLSIFEATNEDDEAYIDEVPYWTLQARRRVRSGDSLGDQIVLITQKNFDLVKEVTIQPGIWWKFADIGTKRLHLPPELLKLPTHGKGHERERMALQLAAVLAIYARAGQKQHAGTWRPYSIGNLLESASIVSRHEFMAAHAEQAKRWRKYLVGPEDDGAIHVLETTGAFEFRIPDSDALHASGRGWKEAFWDAHIELKVPDLQLMNGA